MTDVKKLLDEATPLPWRDLWEHSDPEGDYPVGIKGNDGEPNNWVVRHDDDLGTPLDKNNALIVHAVNHLPDHEAAVDALKRLTWLADGDQDDEEWDDAYREARAVLRRLRGEG